MAETTCQRLTKSQGPGARPEGRQRGVGWVKALLSLRCRDAGDPELSPTDAADRRLLREDSLQEATAALALGDGVPFTAHEFLLFEQLWRTNP
ncbi:MAG TPA: hypothetical protein VL993_01040 [Stellaceae bacterium]|nr:hypothetical protein [Stellaceae bacterium]